MRQAQLEKANNALDLARTNGAAESAVAVAAETARQALPGSRAGSGVQSELTALTTPAMRLTRMAQIDNEELIPVRRVRQGMLRK